MNSQTKRKKRGKPRIRSRPPRIAISPLKRLIRSQRPNFLAKRPQKATHLPILQEVRRIVLRASKTTHKRPMKTMQTSKSRRERSRWNKSSRSIPQSISCFLRSTLTTNWFLSCKRTSSQQQWASHLLNHRLAWFGRRATSLVLRLWALQASQLSIKALLRPSWRSCMTLSSVNRSWRRVVSPYAWVAIGTTWASKRQILYPRKSQINLRSWFAKIWARRRFSCRIQENWGAS